jgi:hypothetical protein
VQNGKTREKLEKQLYLLQWEHKRGWGVGGCLVFFGLGERSMRLSVVRCVGVCVSEQRPAWRRESNEETLVRVVIIVPSLENLKKFLVIFFPLITLVLSTPHSFNFFFFKLIGALVCVISQCSNTSSINYILKMIYMCVQRM